jgi:ribonuclease HI
MNNFLPNIKPNQTDKFIKINNNKIFPINTYVLRFDGCCKGNPGIGGSGAVIYYNDKEIWTKTQFVGNNTTNNIAEYNGLIIGLQGAIDLNIKTLFVEGDSKLIINQMNGDFKVNSHSLIDLYARAKELTKHFQYITFNHIDRKFNKRADEICNISVNKIVKHDDIKLLKI